MAVKPETVRDKIFKALQDDPTIPDVNHIAVKVEKAGFFGKKTIKLVGYVEREQTKKKVMDVVESLAQGVEIVEEIRIKS